MHINSQIIKLLEIVKLKLRQTINMFNVKILT